MIGGPKAMNQPFIIRRNQNRFLIPPESKSFDEKIEGHVKFVQAANLFVAVTFL
jgi:hypothetical protein